jgi:hypothetical protein
VADDADVDGRLSRISFISTPWYSHNHIPWRSEWALVDPCIRFLAYELPTHDFLAMLGRGSGEVALAGSTLLVPHHILMRYILSVCQRPTGPCSLQRRNHELMSTLPAHCRMTPQV